MLNVSIVLFKNSVNELRRIVGLLNSSYLVDVIYLVDNSPGDRLRAVAADYGKVNYYFNPSNPGYGAGHNIAIRKSLAVGSVYHLVVNADVEFDVQILSDMCSLMESRSNIGHIMPKVTYPNGEIQYLCKLLPTPLDLLLRMLPFKGAWFEAKKLQYELRNFDYNSELYLNYMSGCFMFLRGEALAEVGLFDERFFMYPEDIDLSRRISRSYKCLYYPEVKIIHIHAKESHKSLKMMLVHLWNMAKYFTKWGWFFDRERRKENKRLVRAVTKLVNRGN